MKKEVTVIGAGLAGAEAAWQLLRQGIPVTLIDMKPDHRTPAHHNDRFAELVCSNSLRSNRLENASGLLKEELRRLDSLIIKAAEATETPAGGALAVDREAFSAYVTDFLLQHPGLTFKSQLVRELPSAEDGIVIIATGPLTQGGLFDDLRAKLGMNSLHFFDAAAPIIEADSIDMSIAFRQSRYDKGGADYINCPMNEEEYMTFYHALVEAELADVDDFDKETVFEGCMPIETMAKRGHNTIRFGPMKPKGLRDPRTGNRPYAVVQLRQDNRAATMFNLVGFQTRLKWPEQKRVFRLIPGLENAEFFRYGVMHRNTFLSSPGRLNAAYQLIDLPHVFIAGQLSGVEGYVPSASSGLIAGRNAALLLQGKDQSFLPSDQTILGSLAHYISDPTVTDFQPMNANFGIIRPLPTETEEEIKVNRNKQLKIAAYVERSLAEIAQLSDEV